jgi:hypothetical protein
MPIHLNGPGPIRKCANGLLDIRPNQYEYFLAELVTRDTSQAIIMIFLVGRRICAKKDPGCCWGFPKAAVHDLGQRLHGFWERFRGCFKTTTRDGSAYARHYLSGLLRMKGERHFAERAMKGSGLSSTYAPHWDASTKIEWVV